MLIDKNNGTALWFQVGGNVRLDTAHNNYTVRVWGDATFKMQLDVMASLVAVMQYQLELLLIVPHGIVVLQLL